MHLAHHVMYTQPTPEKACWEAEGQRRGKRAQGPSEATTLFRYFRRRTDTSHEEDMVGP